MMYDWNSSNRTFYSNLCCLEMHNPVGGKTELKWAIQSKK